MTKKTRAERDAERQQRYAAARLEWERKQEEGKNRVKAWISYQKKHSSNPLWRDKRFTDGTFFSQDIWPVSHPDKVEKWREWVAYAQSRDSAQIRDFNNINAWQIREFLMEYEFPSYDLEIMFQRNFSDHDLSEPTTIIRSGDQYFGFYGKELVEDWRGELAARAEGNRQEADELDKLVAL